MKPGDPTTIVKSRPISVSPSCAKAILENRKVMVRQLADQSESVCPFGHPGDLLWVREPWALVNAFAVYRSTYTAQSHVDWQPAKSMPEEHAQLWLRLNAARLERLSDIPAGDLASEGSLWLEHPIAGESPKAGFARWWDSLHPRPGTRWADDPWVWVLSFTRT